MKTTNLVKVLGLAIVLSAVAASGATAKNKGYVTKVGCYAAMNAKCYANGKAKCSEDEYAEAIDWCDEIFAGAAVPGQLKATTNGVLKFLLQR